MKKRYIRMLLGVLAIVAADQLTKYWTVQAIPSGGVVPFWEGVLHFTHVNNTGMAFSLFQGGRWVFLTFTAVFLVLVVLAVLRDWLPHPLARIALTMITGGAVGNLIDRLLNGYVVDMIEVEFIRFAVFNVADIFICVGAGFLILAAFFDWKKPEAEHDDSV